ncbi:DUF6765 family protein [Vibrio rotiferianus]
MSLPDIFNPFARNIKSHLAEEPSGALGHGGVATFPDRPYLKWRLNTITGKTLAGEIIPQLFLSTARIFPRCCQHTSEIHRS